MNSTHNPYAQFFAVYAKLKAIGYPYELDELIYQFTQGTYSSIKELNPHDYKELINWLNALYNAENAKALVAETKQKRKIIALFAQMGYTINGKADYFRIDEWCSKYGPIKQRLNYHKGKDLNTLVTQAEKAYQSFIKAV